MDISTLGIAVDSTPVEKATESLDSLVGVSKEAEKAAQKLVDKWKQKAETANFTKQGVDLYKMALQGATQAQIDQAVAVMREVQAHERLAAQLKETQRIEEQGNKFVEGWRIKAATMRMTTNEAELFTAAINGATEAQLKEAKAAMDSIKAHEDAHALGVSIGSAIKTGALAIVGAATAAAAALEVIIFKMGDIQDAAERSGTNADWLVKFKTAADVSETSIDNIAQAMNQMQRQLAKGGDESKGAAKALGELNINISSFQKLDPGAQFDLLARKLAEVEDNGAKVSLVQDLISRGGAQMLPFFKEYAQSIDRQTILTGDAVRAADDFADAQKRAASELKQHIAMLGISALPVISAFKGALMDTARSFLSVGNAASDMTANDKVEAWAKTVGLWLAHVADFLIDVGSRIAEFIAGMVALAKAMGVFLQIKFFDQNSWIDGFKAIDKIHKGFGDTISTIRSGTSVVENFKKQLVDMEYARGQAAEKASSKRDLTGRTSKLGTDKAGDAAAKEEQALIDAINKRRDADNEELEMQRKLTDAEKFQVDMLAKLNSENSKLTPVQKANVLAELERVKSLDAQVEAQRRSIKANQEAWQAEVKAQEEIGAAEKKAFDARMKIRQSLQDQAQATDDAAKALAIEQQYIGGSDEARKRALVNLQEDIRLRKELAAIDDVNSGFENEGQREEARTKAVLESTRRREVEVGKIVLDENKKTFDQIDGIAHQFWDDMFNNGDNAFKNLGKSLKKWLLDMLYQMAKQQFMVNVGVNMSGGGSGNAANSIGSMLGGKGNTLGSLYSVGSQWLTGGMSAGNAIGTLSANAAGTGIDGLLATNAAYGTAAEGGAMAGGALAAEGGGMAAGMGAAMSTIATVMPYVAIGYAIYSMFSSKGGGPKVGGAYGLLGAPGIVGPDDNSMTSGLQTQAKSALDSFNKLVTQLGGHNPGLQFGIGISTDPRGTAPSFVQTQVTQDGQLVRNEVNTNVGRDNAAVAAEVARQLNESIIDALHRSGIDQEILGYFDQITAGADAAGKAAAISMLPQLAALKQAFSGMATVFPYLSQTSIQAKIAMTQLAGGIDQLSGLMGGFMATFFTAGEQMQIVSGQLQTQLATVGITADVMNMSMQQYRDMVMNLSTQTNTAAGQAAFVTSLQASAAFAQMKQQQQAEADRLKAEWEQQQAQAKAQADAAQAEYDRKLSTAQSNLQNAYQSQRDAIQKTIDSLKNWKQALSDLRDSLSTDSSLSPLTPTQQYAAAGTRLQELAIDARNGDTTAQGKFDQAARQFLALSRQQYASGEQYSRDFKMVSDMLDNLSASATSQISAAERQQQALDASVSVLLSIDKGVLSVDQAIRELINVKNSAPAPYVPPTAYNPNPAGSASAPTYTPPPPTAQTAAPAGSGAGVGTAPAAAPMNWTTWAAGIQNEPTGFAEGLDRVPKDGFYRLHAGEKVLNDKEAGIARQSPDLAKELAALREELASLRKENRQDAGSQISALFDAIQELAEKLGQATINSARTREYLSKPRSTLS